MKNYFITTILTLLFFNLNAQTKVFQKKNYKIDYPTTWRVDTSGLMGTEVFFFSPLENEMDKFSENYNLIIQDLGNEEVSIEQYKEYTESQIANVLTDYKFIDSNIIDKNSYKLYELNYEFTQGVFRIRTKAQVRILNKKAYLNTFTTESKNYERYKLIGEETLSSFSIIK